MAAVGLALIIAIVLAIGSSGYERVGPELAEVSDLCEPDRRAECMKPLLNGGYPLPYLYDEPGISVSDRLHFVEDHFRVIPFVLDSLWYFAIIIAPVALWAGARAWLALRRLRPRAVPPG